jgi:hypothetical protein
MRSDSAIGVSATDGGMWLGVVGVRKICFNFLHFVQHCGIALGLATAPVGISGV